MAVTKAKTAHVNMMTDTIIANLPLEGLRAVMRGVLSSHPAATPAFEEQTRNYLLETTTQFKNVTVTARREDGSSYTTPALQDLRKRICCMVGCGMCYEALPLLQQIVRETIGIIFSEQDSPLDDLAAVDGDIVQALTAIQKTLLSPTGTRELSPTEAEPVARLHESVLMYQKDCTTRNQPFLLERAADALTSLLKPDSSEQVTIQRHELAPEDIPETFTLNGSTLPRIFTGLWQLSSPAWGSASRSKMLDQFSSYVQRGFTAFDMADHYGDAEIIFGRYRSSSAYSDKLFAATKYCIFHPMTVTEEAVRANVSERCRRLNTGKIDLLQFHWQFYDDDQYIKALQYLQSDPRVKQLGLCNFDTEHMQKVIESGIKIVSNQVQFSLIDSRPTIKMASFCDRHNIKLLTYGTLLGGFLAEKWIGQPAPDLYSDKTTPSQRKYYAMIRSWGGWDLFQELLLVLQGIATKHGVSVSNVATRWVLDFECVGAVIVGARMGVSEHFGENLASLGWRLDSEDRGRIEAILERSSRREMFESMGDCGGEYR
ncbi:NADP-dependent oxidoreductase domain-containing protein [Aspergillus granulosus]|uniref:NADP-dependent oxidoreductase domain-containing protein n=1 Tax=Aspergillus granulosus TaxID=176169 RepID=A0ABR4HYG0_9EURO